MTTILVNDFVIVLMAFLRIAAMFFTAPFFSNNTLPVTVKIFFALITTYIVFFSIKNTQFNVDDGIGLLIIWGIKEVLTGMMIGFAFNFIFWGISFAGMLMGTDIGFGMASVFNPSVEFENNLIGEIFFLFSTLIFLVLNGHHHLIRGITISFELIPIGTYTITDSIIQLLVKYSAGVFILAVKIASPILISFFLVHIAMGVISRVLPQMQVFFIVQPLQFGIGFILILASAPILVYVIKNIISTYEDTMYELLRAMSR
jgi:flagellar biosynthetic protein FliR